MRLSPTSDALDASHAERDAEERAALVASAAVRQAEEERDEMREAFALLVEKCDWRVLRPAALRFANPADSHVPREHDDSEAYVQPLLLLLSSQLDSDRRGREDAEQQVARREPELEAPLYPRADGRSNNVMTHDAALGVLELTVGRNQS